MKKDWEIKILGEVCDFKSGTTIDPALEKSSGEVLYVKVGDMNLIGNEQFITTSSRYVDLTEIKEQQLIPIGSIIFPKRGGAIATNKKRRVTMPTIVDLNTMALVPSNIIDNEYLYFWFKQIDLADLSNGTSIPQINNYSFDKLFISYPKDKKEQKRIVKILDEKFEVIEELKKITKEQLASVEELFESRLNQVFSVSNDWVTSTLGKIGKTQTGITPKTSEVGYYGDYVPFIKPADVDFDGKGSVNLKNVGLSEKGLLVGRKIPKNSIVMVCIGATIGKIGFVEDDVSCNQQINTLSPDKAMNAKFLYYAMRTKSFYDLVIHDSSQATLPIINKGKWEKLPVSFPKSVREQNNIVKELDELVDKTKELELIFRKKITDLEELKKSYLHQAFSGNL